MTGVAIDKINVTVKGDQVFVDVKDDSNNEVTSLLAATEKLPVYHMVAEHANNENKGYWTEYNSINETLRNDAATAYIIKNAAGRPTAIYVIANGLFESYPIG